ncbi:putative gustatory receptor 28a [Schistocerca piceifrons]|uniref:putative gustatory receptor 28a n=1 Tax=Schistocerca piceifrons TaxID=274613 RepID=UPI001F5FCD5A|nr:putative gustatory receptor 28a [Schistocerca piceifrons]
MMFKQGFTRPEMEPLALLAIIWTFIVAGEILAVTWSCSAVASESGRTADLVLKALLPPPRNTARDAELRYQLQLFSKQLLHRRPRFTACGIFVINLSNVSSMVAAVVSYLVVMAQINAVEGLPDTYRH